MIIDKTNNGKQIYKSWRENGVRKQEIVDFAPYFFIEQDAPKPPKYRVNQYINGEFVYEEGDFYNLKGDKLVKCYYEKADDVKKARESFSHTYEGDVPYRFRYAVDEIDEMPEYNLRKWYWDMEWQQGGEHHNKITTIVAYDNWDKQYYQWVWFPKESKELVNETLKWSNGDIVKNVFYSEKHMLEDFMTTMITKDPDMLIAWFGNFADIPKLLERTCELGLNPNIISPFSESKGVSAKNGKYVFKDRYKEKGFSPIEQPIAGRITL